ncbi:hypothetical protein [Meiothermus sp. Pnk-1]|uniref:hypothetical protein n=1 Tax=Meiothermus sp. Pnk-1 TaxID=873128 RepID=UPI0013143068|nr:hypothetical protein [Meiothermus sp. Pnk-1]
MLRLESLSRGEGDPVAADEEQRAMAERFAGLDAWDNALPGGRGYDGPRGQARYG